MANGVVLIDQWFFRFAGSVTDTIAGGQSDLPRTRLFARESGGEVASATWPDGFSWRAALGTFRGHAISPNGLPARGTVIGLVETDYQATADDDGSFEISNLLPG